jgi:AraC-like DNA-binding protein
VSAQPASDLSVHQLAARVGVSRRHFSRLCAEQVSTSPPRYVVQVRIESARQLLETDSLDPSNIASQPASQPGRLRPPGHHASNLSTSPRGHTRRLPPPILKHQDMNMQIAVALFPQVTELGTGCSGSVAWAHGDTSLGCL